MKENNVILSIVQSVRGLKQQYDSWGILNWCNKNPIILCAFDHCWPFGKNNKMCHGGLSVINITHRKFLEVTAVQGIVKMLGDVFPGGQPVVSLLFPGVVMVPPWWGGKRPPNLKYVKNEYTSIHDDAKSIHFYCFLDGQRDSPDWAGGGQWRLAWRQRAKLSWETRN